MIPVLSSSEAIERLKVARKESVGYRAMYSSWLGGVVTEPWLMLLPIDDHMVHRGDGVFEAVRIVDGAIYDLNGHLQRLKKSAQAVALELPDSLEAIGKTCVETARASGLRDGIIRFYVSRGPGSFSPNPYESVGSQLYVVVCDLKLIDEKKYVTGARAMVSSVPAKENFYSGIKSCNYLPNVLMKKEAVESNVDFAISVNPQQVICEGPTENIFMIDSAMRMKVPKFDYTLRGTTLVTVVELVQAHMPAISSVEFADLTLSDFTEALEVFMVGTTIEVFPVTVLNGVKIGSGQPGPIGREMRMLLKADMRTNTRRRTEIGL